MGYGVVGILLIVLLVLVILYFARRVVSEAQLAAEKFGIPAQLFWSICEYLETHLVDTPNPHYRYAPNTRASALRECRKLWAVRFEESLR